MVRYFFAYLFLTFPAQFSKSHVTRCLGDLVTKPDKITTTKPASKVRNQLYLTKMILTRFIIKTFSWYFREEKIPDWRIWIDLLKRWEVKISGLLFERIISVSTNFNSSLPIKSIHLRPPLMLMLSVFQQHRHLRNRLYGIKMDHIQWSGLGPVEIQWHIPSPQQ